MSTSELQKQVSELLEIHLGAFSKRENHRPEWMLDETFRRLELDFYIPDLKIAIEVQGAQHYVFVPHFHKTYEQFQDMLLRDQLKKDACHRLGITLFEVSELDDCYSVIEGIKLMLSTPITFSPPDATLLNDLAKLLNVRAVKGKRAESKLAIWKRAQAEILDRIAAMPELLTSIDPKVATWLIGQLQKAERIITTFEAVIENKKQIRSFWGSKKNYEIYKAWKREYFAQTGEEITPEEYKALMRRERNRKNRHKPGRTIPNSGFVIMYSIEGIYRILYTTKTPERQKRRLNEYRGGHVQIWQCHFTSDLREHYREIVSSFNDRAVVDSKHKDGWFNLTPEDVEYIKSLGGEA